MSRLRLAWRFVLSLSAREKRERELEGEIRSYTDLLADEKISRGIDHEEAQRRARMEIGGVEQVKEMVRDRRTGAPLAAFLQDIQYGFRMLRKKPGFTAVTVATLALGIGANTAIFSVVNATLLTPVPIPSADRVTRVWTDNPARGFRSFPASIPDYLDWQASGIFSQLAAFNSDGFNIRLGNTAERVEGLTVTPEWFAILGRQPLLGRTFRADEMLSTHSSVVVLNWSFWNTRFHADPTAIGKTLIVNGAPHTVIGVLPKGTARFEHEELYVPAAFDNVEAKQRGSRSWLVLGRLAPGFSLSTAQMRMNALGERLAKQYPDEDRGQTSRLQLVEESYVEDVRGLLLVLFGAVGFVLLIACANIANLLLARGTARRKEIAIRVALGANRSRVFCQLLSESLLLAILGAVAGIVPAFFGVHLIPKLSSELPNAELISLNGTALLFTLALAIMAGILFGLLPAFQFWKAETNQPLRQSERGQTSRSGKRWADWFVIAEVAFTLILLTGASLMLRSFLQIRNQNPGYDSHNVLTMNIALTGRQFNDPKKQSFFFDNVLGRLSRLPGVESAAAADAIPGGESMHGSGLHFTDRPEPKPGDVPVVLTSSISPDYFRTMAIPLRRGRAFTAADNATAARVVVIDEIAVKKYWPHSDPLGQSVKLEPKGPSLKVVGVVASVQQNSGLTLVMGEVGEVYLPLAQAPKPGVSLLLRTHTDPAGAITAVRRTVSQVDRDVPLYLVQTLEELRAQGRASARLGTVLLACFGIIALSLASIGVFGVVSFTVGQRIREFGIRIAVGASAWDLLKLTIGRGALLVSSGVAIGLLGSLGLTRLMSGLVTGISSSDPLSFLAAILILLLVGLLASYLPARRATKIDPNIALRSA